MIGLMSFLFGAEGLGQKVMPLAALLMLQSLLSVRCSFPQFGHLLCGHWVCAFLEVVQTWSFSY
jgi:hypothetical protein